eukprot:4965175-Heterocapsa_arctica.AAC.1
MTAELTVCDPDGLSCQVRFGMQPWSTNRPAGDVNVDVQLFKARTVRKSGLTMLKRVRGEREELLRLLPLRRPTARPQLAIRSERLHDSALRAAYALQALDE